MNRSRNRRNRVADLLKIYSGGGATSKEEQELFNILEIDRDEAIIKKHIQQLLVGHQPNDEASATDWERLYQKIAKEKNKQPTAPVIRSISWIRWAAAAFVILLLGAGYYFFTYKKQEQQGEVVKTERTMNKDIAPPNTANAVLTLANGRKVILDSTGNGTLALQGAVNVIKLADGQIAYRGTSKEVEYNTLSNPRGSKVISLLLADGSKVWLNAASSLKYPTAFTGKERKVEITGEAYFEVAHNPDKPFIVSKAGTSIKVLGTHFNVNAYDDESSLDVTLLEGSVSVVADHSLRPEVIKPGTQAQVKRNGNIQLDNSVDLNEVMAWKNGLFSFKGDDIQSIMRQVSRWYDVEVIFKEPVKEKFYAEVSKSTNVSTLLEMLEATKAVQFKIEGNTITVMP
jgi:ferric-dicitrate binding protein FerR (iron transport regulator)